MRRTWLWSILGTCLLILLTFGAWNAGAHPAGTGPDASAPAITAPPPGAVPAAVKLRDASWQRPANIDRRTGIDQRLLAGWSGNPNAIQGFMVYLKAQADTSNDIADWNAKGAYVLRQLQAVADATQPAVQQHIEALRAARFVTSSTRFTIINAIFVHGNLAAARALAARPDVAYVEADHRYFPLSSSAALPQLGIPLPSSPLAIEPGVARVHAPQVWATGDRGQGIVVGHIDTGEQYDHPALVRQYRGNLGGGNFDHNYNWWDTTLVHSPTPYDDAGHGTHTMGTVLGEDAAQTNQIGVAPAAKWMSAKVFPNGGSSGNEEITPAEDFMLAPWDLNHANRDPSKRPRLVSNSWGDNECYNTDSWLITQAWIDAGIIPVFANGNAGPQPGTVGSPGGYPFDIGVGAIDAANDTIAGFSSRGPSCYGGVLKPDVVAPGVNVRSSLPTNTYGNYSGTSMATPHVAGVIALMLSANPALSYTDTFSILTRTTYFAPSWGSRPNNNYGWGLVQADNAVNMALHAARVAGTVTSNGAPVGHADVTAVRTSDNDTYHVQTGGDGSYHFYLLAGTYNVTASAFAYAPQTISGQSFMTDTTTTLNITLAAQATYPLSGHLLLAGACSPLSGTVSITPPGTLTVTANLADGSYSANLPAGTYTLYARAGAGLQPVRQTVQVNGPTAADLTFGPAHDASYVVDRPAYNWVAGTTQLTFTDNNSTADFEDGEATVPLPFSFTYYGTAYNTIYMSVNGYATFDPGHSGQPSMWANTDIPNPGPTPAAGDPPYPNNALYPYWDDLAMAPRAAYGAGYWSVSGSAPNRVFVLEWRNVAGAGAPITFEVQLEESTNRVTFVYQTLNAPYGYGYSATEGIENAAGTDGIEFGWNEMGIVGDRQAYRFTPAQAPAIVPCVLPTETATATATNTAVPSSTRTATRTAGPTETKTAVASATATTGIVGSTPTETTTPLASATPCGIRFTDVIPADYFYTPVQYLACHGVISGYSDHTFRPFNNTTRGQMVKIVVLGFNLQLPPAPIMQTFEDVPPANPFFTAIAIAAARNIVSGYTCGHAPAGPCIPPDNRPYFLPNTYVTRGQLAKIVVIAAGFPLITPSTPTFEDVLPASPFYSYIETLAARGLISGYTCGHAPAGPCLPPGNRPYFLPGNNATRGQIAKIVYNAIQALPMASPTP